MMIGDDQVNTRVRWDRPAIDEGEVLALDCLRERIDGIAGPDTDTRLRECFVDRANGQHGAPVSEVSHHRCRTRPACIKR